jgi:hypothetical protein
VFLYTVQLAEPGLLVRGEASEEGIEVWNHAFVQLNDLRTISIGLYSWIRKTYFVECIPVTCLYCHHLSVGL